MMSETMNSRTKLILLSVVIFAGAYFLYTMGDLVRLIVISALLAYIFDPLVTRLESYGLSRTTATGIFTLLLVALIALGIYKVIPVIAQQFATLSSDMQSVDSQQLMGRFQGGINKLLAIVGIQDPAMAEKLSNLAIEKMLNAFSGFLAVLKIFTNLLIIPFITFFLMKDGRSIKKYLISLVPNRYFEFTCNLLYKMDDQLGNYFRGQLYSVIIISSLAVLLLWLLNVPYALFLGIFAGVANVIPYVGPFAGAAMAVLVSVISTGTFTLTVPILLAFVVVQLVDNFFVQPTILAKNVALPPLILLFAVIIGGKFFGILGMLLAVPFAAIAKVAMEESIALMRQYRFR
jgi:predicted PurR-regulated permease PerM